MARRVPSSSSESREALAALRPSVDKGWDWANGRCRRARAPGRAARVAPSKAIRSTSSSPIPPMPTWKGGVALRTLRERRRASSRVGALRRGRRHGRRRRGRHGRQPKQKAGSSFSSTPRVTRHRPSRGWSTTTRTYGDTTVSLPAGFGLQASGSGGSGLRNESRPEEALRASQYSLQAPPGLLKPGAKPEGHVEE